MGVVYKPEDILRGRKGIIERGLQDVSPGMRDTVLKILEAWEGKPSEDKLAKLIGKDQTKRLIESLKR
jgi:hypothetical protein